MSRLTRLIEEGLSSDRVRVAPARYVSDAGPTAAPTAAQQPSRLAQPGDALLKLERKAPVPDEFYKALNGKRKFHLLCEI
jgi:hypothetical protein